MYRDVNAIGNFAAILTNIGNLRAGLIVAQSDKIIEERIESFCDALSAWCSLPEIERRVYYGRLLLECLFNIAEDIECNERFDERERLGFELALWDVSVALKFDSLDERYEFIARRRDVLLRSLMATAPAGAESLLYCWAWLLRRRTGLTEHRSVFHEDANAVIAELVSAGALKVAKSLSLAFRLPADPLLELALRFQSQTSEAEHAKKLMQRVARPTFSLPYQAAKCARALHQVLVASPIASSPISVNGACVTIGTDTFGFTKHRY